MENQCDLIENSCLVKITLITTPFLSPVRPYDTLSYLS